MTDFVPTTPPPELVQELWKKLRDQTQELGAEDAWDRVITLAYRAGADMELEACCEWLAAEGRVGYAAQLCGSRRPKPPSLAEESLALIDKIQGNKKMWQLEELDVVRRALERLQELENND